MTTANNAANRAASKNMDGRNGAQFRYVLDCIESSSRATDEGAHFENHREAIAFFFGCFDKEFNYTQNRKRFPNLQNRIADYLQGLPSCFNIDYWESDIVEIGKKWGFCQTEKKAEAFCKNWFNMVALRIIQAAEKVGLNVNRYI